MKIIRSKTPQLINPQMGISAIVYMFVELQIKARELKQRHIIIHSAYVDGNGKAVIISETKAVFKEATFVALFGDLTIDQFNEMEGDLLIQQIDYTNKYVWTGNEAQPEPVRYWDFEAADLEVIPLEEIPACFLN